MLLGRMAVSAIHVAGSAIILATHAVGQDPGEVPWKYRADINVTNYRLGWLQFPNHPRLREYTRLVVKITNLAALATYSVLGGAIAACQNYVAMAHHCDVRLFGKSIQRLSNRIGIELAHLKQNALLFHWAPLPQKWAVLHSDSGNDGPYHFQEFLGNAGILLTDFLYKVLHVAQQGHDVVPIPWFRDVARNCQNLTIEIIRFADRFTAAITLKQIATELEEAAPGSLARSVVWDSESEVDHRRIIESLLKQLPAQTFVAELGTHIGLTPLHLLQKFPNLHMLTVDPFDVVPLGYSKEELEQQRIKREGVFRLLHPYGMRVIVLPTTAAEASLFVKDGMFDLGYVDGGKRDLEIHLWKDKVRAGGWLIGHDFRLGMDLSFFVEIFKAAPLNETIHLGADWTWYFRM